MVLICFWMHYYNFMYKQEKYKCIFLLINLTIIFNSSHGLQLWLYTWQVVDAIPTRGNEKFNIIISLLWCGALRGKAWCCVPSLYTQFLPYLTESEERSLLTLGYLRLPCYKRDTAWSWKKNAIFDHTYY